MWLSVLSVNANFTAKYLIFCCLASWVASGAWIIHVQRWTVITPHPEKFTDYESIDGLCSWRRLWASPVLEEDCTQCRVHVYSFSRSGFNVYPEPDLAKVHQPQVSCKECTRLKSVRPRFILTTPWRGDTWGAWFTSITWAIASPASASLQKVISMG